MNNLHLEQQKSTRQFLSKSVAYITIILRTEGNISGMGAIYNWHTKRIYP